MSGLKQHYIPQSFQRPFKISDGTNKEQVWCYRKGQNGPFKGRIGDIAAERYFYSKPLEDDAETLDDAITRYENRLTYLINNIRSLRPGVAVPVDVAAESIAHLTYRSKSIRHLMEESFFNINSVIDQTTNFLDRGFDPKLFPAAPIPHGLETFIVENLQRETEGHGIAITDNTLSRIAYAYCRENSEEILENFRHFVELFQQLLKQEKADKFRTRHSESFEGMFPIAIFEQLATFEWDIIELPDGEALLPDCIGIASDDGENFHPILGRTKSASTILVPISPNKILCGNKSRNFTFDIKKFNLSAARCSSELFISSTPNLSGLQKEIGRALSEFVADALHKVGRDFVSSISIQDSAHSANDADVDSESSDFTIVVSFPEDAVKGIDQDRRLELARKLVASLGSDFGKLCSELVFCDPVSAAYEYAQATKEAHRVESVRRIRSDELSAVLPGENTRKHRLCVSENLLGTIIDKNQTEEGFKALQSAATDLLLAPIYDGYDDGYFSEVDEIFIVPAVRSLRAFNRNVRQFNGIALDPEYSAGLISNIQSLWKITDLNGLRQRHKNEAEALAELLERMSASMVQVSLLAAAGTKNLASAAEFFCSDIRFVKWFLLFEKDLRVAIELLVAAQNPQAGQIIGAHLERLMWGMGFTFEQDPDGGVRYQYRANFPQFALPVPFEQLVESAVVP